MSSSAALTARDVSVVLDVYKHRYLSVSQLHRLHFPSLQTTYRRLRALVSAGYVSGFVAPPITEHLYYLEAKGADLVASTLGLEVSDLKWAKSAREPKDYYFLRHFLAVNDFRIALALACSKSEINLRGFIPEYFGQKTEGGVAKYIKDFVCDIGKPSDKISHTPDAVFALEKGGRCALFFLEVDRGTEVISDEEKGVLKHVRFYLNYLHSGGYKRYETDFSCEELRGFRALFVTSSATRAANMRTAISRLEFAGKAKQFIWITAQQEIEACGVLEPIWRSADSADSNVYRIG